MFIHHGVWLLKPVTSPLCCFWLESFASVTEAPSCQEVPQSPLKPKEKESHLIKEPHSTPSCLVSARCLESSEWDSKQWAAEMTLVCGIGSKVRIFTRCWDAVWLHGHHHVSTVGPLWGNRSRMESGYKRPPRCPRGALIHRPCGPAAGLKTHIRVAGCSLAFSWMHSHD